MKIYENLSQITVYAFYKIIETDDYTYLIKNREKYIDKKDSINKIDLENKFKVIIYEYSEKTKNFKLLNDFKKRYSISKLELELILMSSIMDCFKINEEIEVLFLLDELGFNFKECDSINLELKKVIKKCKLLKNRIRIYKIKYSSKNNNENQNDNKSYNLDKMALQLERALDLSYNINVKKTTMIRWINLLNLSKTNKK